MSTDGGHGYSIVMQSINTIRQDPIETLPLHRKRIAIQPEDVVGVDLPNGLLDAFVKTPAGGSAAGRKAR